VPAASRTIDIQGHYLPEAYADSLARRGFDDMLALLERFDSERRIWRLDDARLAAMDAAGLDVQVISLTPPAAALLPKEQASEATELNDGLIDAARRYPDRFLVLCSLPFPHVEQCVAELDRLAAEPLVRGALIDTYVTDFTLDEERLEPVFARLADLRMPAVLHPATDLPESFSAFGIGASLGPMVSTSLTGLRLVLSGLLDRVPELELVIPHLGGTIPYLVQRVIDLNGKGAAERDLLWYLRNRIWTDTCNFWPPALRCAIETFGFDRIMLGSDYPFRGPLDTCLRDIEAAGLDDAARDAILSGTADRWFGPERLV
jgi:predicted TIM-barrel fold metal-dependent hydrolase